MANLITGLIGVVLVAVFLGFYAIGIRSLPLSIIVVAIMMLVLADFIQTVRKGNNHTGG